MWRFPSVMPVLLCCFALDGCSGSPVPVSPTRSSRPVDPPPMTLACVTSPALTCTATVLGPGDVTPTATWSAVESLAAAEDPAVNPSSAVVFLTPGVPTALRTANVYIRADYNSRWGTHSFRFSAPYQLTPGGDVIPLALFPVLVLSGPCVAAPCDAVGGATVEIIEGEGVGKSATTTSYGGSAVLEFLHLHLPFTVRASKSGYASAEGVCAGIDRGAPLSEAAGMRLVINKN